MDVGLIDAVVTLLTLGRLSAVGCRHAPGRPGRAQGGDDVRWTRKISAGATRKAVLLSAAAQRLRGPVARCAPLSRFAAHEPDGARHNAKAMPGAGASGLTSEQLDAVDHFWKREATRIAASVRDLPWVGGLAAREALAQAVEEERSKGGFLTKETFDDVLQWGFGKRSRLGEEEIRTATREAFARLGSGDETGAVQRLRALKVLHAS